MAAITSALYTVLPRIPWWLVLQLAACVLGMTAVFASALKTGAKNRVPLILILALMGVFGAGLFYYGIVLGYFYAQFHDRGRGRRRARFERGYGGREERRGGDT